MDESFDYVRRIIPATETMFITPAAVPVGFQGAGDIVSGALGWWGLRAYTLASIGGNCVDIKRASDNATNTFVTVAGGGVDIASIATFLNATTGTVTQLYDQTGNGLHFVFSVTAAAFTLSGIGSLPVMTFSVTETYRQTTGITRAQPVTFTAVCNTTSTAGKGSTLISGFQTAIDAGIYADVSNISCYAGTGLTTPNPTGSLSIIAVVNGGTSSINVNGTTASGNAGANTLVAAHQSAIGNDPFVDSFTGKWMEGGIWGSGFNGTQVSNMNSNQRSYWGF